MSSEMKQMEFKVLKYDKSWRLEANSANDANSANGANITNNLRGGGLNLYFTQ